MDAPIVGNVSPSNGPVRRAVATMTVSGTGHTLLCSLDYRERPVITCPDTGRRWVIDWTELGNLAVAAGIDLPQPVRTAA